MADATEPQEFMCGRGHRASPSASGCPECGSTTFHLIEPPDNEHRPETPSRSVIHPRAQPPRATPAPEPVGRCGAGHQVPLSQARCNTCGLERVGARVWGCGHLRQEGANYCGTCGYSSALEPVETSWLSGIPTRARIAVVVFVVVIVLAGLAVWQAGKPTLSHSASNLAAPTTTRTVQEECTHNLAVWVVSMSRDVLNGGGGLGPAMAFGSQSYIGQEIVHLESAFTAEVFQKGTSTAFADVTASSSQACSQMSQDDVNLLVTTATPS